MRKIGIRIINNSGYDLPDYMTEQSAGCDLVAPIDAPIKLYPLDRVFINTKVSVALPDGYEASVRTRSGLNKNHGIVCPLGQLMQTIEAKLVSLSTTFQESHMRSSRETALHNL